MAFRVGEQHIQEFLTLGRTIFRGIVPASLVVDLRRACDRARDLARERHGAQAQRLQPLAKFGLDHRPFQDYFDLPELRAVIDALLSPQHGHGGPDIAGVLIEPAQKPWATPWHRDMDRAHIGEHRARLFTDHRFFNQVNCALYDDDCTWLVPGSHHRWDDTPGERAAVGMPDLAGLSEVEVERVLAGYCRAMPGAEQLRLGPGDYALYRNTGWHLGNYAPSRRRATIHDLVDTADWKSLRRELDAEWKARAEQPRRAEAVAAA